MKFSSPFALSILSTVITFSSPLAALAQSTAPVAPARSDSQSASWEFCGLGRFQELRRRCNACDCGRREAIERGVLLASRRFSRHLRFRRRHATSARASRETTTISAYLQTAWDDFLQNQIAHFGTLPVFLGIGNHDTISPRTRDGFIIQFADWLNAPVLRDQRLLDNPNDRKLKTYYHWIDRGIDFINLDNATDDQFDYYQMKWFEQVLQAASSNPAVHTIVVGMHEALPDSISENHAMDQFAQGRDSGRRVYADLIKAQNEAHKRVYVIASHSHYYMVGIFNTPYWREHGGVLPGWIVGTAGAVRYSLPPEKRDAIAAETNVYGFLTGTVKTDGEIDFTFQRLSESDVPPAIVERYTPPFVHWCFAENSVAH